MSASIEKESAKIGQIATKQNKQTNQTNKTNDHFLPKINKVFLGPILQNLKGRSALDNFFLKMILSTSWNSEKDATKQKVLSRQGIGQKRKMVIKIDSTPLLLS